MTTDTTIRDNVNILADMLKAEASKSVATEDRRAAHATIDAVSNLIVGALEDFASIASSLETIADNKRSGA
ncbi:hypothetical protein [Xanthobacter aminoxidans]|uniref:hypothetical protein n=1 Tax=Xanthobacter aminoxidans TaxID=186280 RepID=UPI002022E78F|nr:hypothetical protein [Xanthobacter aminoxidans]MCL8382105.1 hypothetical protein [Xanthobacter aminoxidans]